MRLVLIAVAAMTLTAEEKPAPKYVVHWTSEVRDYTIQLAVYCSPGTPDCGVAYATQNNWSPMESKEQLDSFIKSMVGGEPHGFVFGQGSWTVGRNPRIVAIYELKPVPAKITEERIETPMPPKVEVRQKVVLP